MMRGNGVIVFRLNNGHHDHYEHPTISAAKSEAGRLANEIGGRYVIYAPVAIVERTPPIRETPISIPGIEYDHESELPF